MDLSLSSLDLGPLGTFLEIRTPVLDSQGFVRKDCYEPYKIHLSKFGQNVVGSKINKLLMQIVKSTQIQVQVPTPLTPAAVSIPHPREAELARLWLLVKGYPIPNPVQLQSLLSPSLPLPAPSPPNAELANDQMETDAPVEVETIDTPAPDYPETDDEDQATNNELNTNAAAIVSNDQNEQNSNVISDPNLVRSPESEPSGSNSNQIKPIQPALRPQRPAFFAGPPSSSSSDTVQAAPIDQVEFIPTRASTPTPNLDMLDQTSGSATSQVTLDASKLLADHDQSMVGANETIVEKMQKTDLKPKLDVIMEEPEPGNSSQIEQE
jgi:hypothetical protein